MSGLVSDLLLDATLLADTQVYLNGNYQGDQHQNAPALDLAGSAALAGYDYSVSTNMAGGFVAASVGVIHMAVSTSAQVAAGDGNENDAGASASAFTQDATIPTADLAINFSPVFLGGVTPIDAGASGEFLLYDVTSAPYQPVATEYAQMDGTRPHAETVDLIAGHTYELDVSAIISASGEGGGGTNVNGAADLTDTVGVLIQQLDGSGAVVPGNPGLQFASGYDYSVSPACFAAGTRIATEAGEVAVERLRAGDLVVTRSGRTRPVRWVGHRHTEPARPVRIAADAFAPACRAVRCCCPPTMRSIGAAR